MPVSQHYGGTYKADGDNKVWNTAGLRKEHVDHGPGSKHDPLASGATGGLMPSQAYPAQSCSGTLPSWPFPTSTACWLPSPVTASSFSWQVPNTANHSKPCTSHLQHKHPLLQCRFESRLPCFQSNSLTYVPRKAAEDDPGA